MRYYVFNIRVPFCLGLVLFCDVLNKGMRKGLKMAVVRS
jgi:hypothetical protein